MKYSCSFEIPSEFIKFFGIIDNNGVFKKISIKSSVLYKLQKNNYWFFCFEKNFSSKGIEFGHEFSFFFKENHSPDSITVFICSENFYKYDFFDVFLRIFFKNFRFNEIDLHINGVGFKAKLDKDFIILHLGYSHSVVIKKPVYINKGKREFPDNWSKDLLISGYCFDGVNEFCSRMANLKKKDSYKGKGISFFGQDIILKSIKKDLQV